MNRTSTNLDLSPHINDGRCARIQVETEHVEVTQGGQFGIPADHFSQYARGTTSYFRCLLEPDHGGAHSMGQITKEDAQELFDRTNPNGQTAHVASTREEKAADVLDAWGTAIRMNWGDIDGRSCKRQLQEISAYLRGERDSLALEDVGVCVDGERRTPHWSGDGEWYGYHEGKCHE